MAHPASNADVLMARRQCSQTLLPHPTSPNQEYYCADVAQNSDFPCDFLGASLGYDSFVTLVPVAFIAPLTSLRMSCLGDGIDALKVATE
jgi:hypothetical protein